jgi:predicted methyltransferase
MWSDVRDARRKMFLKFVGEGLYCDKVCCPGSVLVLTILYADFMGFRGCGVLLSWQTGSAAWRAYAKHMGFVMRVQLPLFLILLLGSAASVQAATSPDIEHALAVVINGPLRSADNVARDKYRHPEQTLEFFGIRPNMRVIEVLPGGGWYTEILAPFLRDHGQLVEATPSESSRSPFARKIAMRYAEKLAANPAVYGRVTREPFELPNYMPLGAPDSADMVLTFRNMHDLVFANVHGVTTDALLQRFLRSAYRVLKPGGTLGIVAHRANPDMPAAKSFKLGRLPQAFLVQEVEQAGFHLAATSEVNANGKDPRTMPVWFLPPSLGQGQEDRTKYEGIGEADNMTLKFVKPAQ